MAGIPLAARSGELSLGARVLRPQLPCGAAGTSPEWSVGGRPTLAGNSDESEWGPKMTTLGRIAAHTNVMGGRPCVRGTRITVGLVVKLVANGL